MGGSPSVGSTSAFGLGLGVTKAQVGFAATGARNGAATKRWPVVTACLADAQLPAKGGERRDIERLSAWCPSMRKLARVVGDVVTCGPECHLAGQAG